MQLFDEDFHHTEENLCALEAQLSWEGIYLGTNKEPCHLYTQVGGSLEKQHNEFTAFWFLRYYFKKEFLDAFLKLFKDHFQNNTFLSF
jgi:hypothetical protein